MKICKIKGCKAEAKGRGWCSKHHTRFLRYGNPLTMKRAAPKVQPDHCSIKNCPSPPYSLGFCVSHYTRQRRHGDPLGGRTAKGEPFKWLIKHVQHSKGKCLDWPFAKGRGYGLIVHKGKFMSAPKLMCEMAHGPAPSPLHECAHSCGNGNKGCINPKHLRWATRSENHSDKYLHKTMPIGENHCRSKLTEKQVVEIRKLQGVESSSFVAKRYPVSNAAILAIWNRKNWAWLK